MFLCILRRYIDSLGVYAIMLLGISCWSPRNVGYELRQARKGATVVADSCAAEWLARATNLYQTENEYVCLNLSMKTRSLEQSQ